MRGRRLLGRLVSSGGERLPAGVRRAMNNARGIETPAVVDRPKGSPVLVLAPHPDDELIGCGGTLVKHLAAGDDVHVALVTSGERTVGLAGFTSDEAALRREREAADAASVLGLPPGNLHMQHERDGAVTGQSIAPLLERVRPRLVYAPHPADAHRDHRATAAALADAIPTSVERIALYEVWTPIAADTVVDITEQLEQKLAALAHYRSALQSVDYLHTVRGLAAYRSAQGLRGRGYAEAFTVLSPPAFRQLVAAVAASVTRV